MQRCTYIVYLLSEDKVFYFHTNSATHQTQNTNDYFYNMLNYEGLINIVLHMDFTL